MHIEIQVALNFLISFLYNKLPRRRVNQFGEELEKILRRKFDGHWYPEKPYKGSAYRCIHCNPQLDSSLFREAARNSGLNLKDVQENLPHELSIWIDPGEVSYRISEKGPVNILYDSKVESSTNGTTVATNHYHVNSARSGGETLGLNPEAQCFMPVVMTDPTYELIRPMTAAAAIPANQQQPQHEPIVVNPLGTFSSKNDPVTFTTAAFAATKFGSTKPKAQLSKKYQRGSPTINETNKPFFPPKVATTTTPRVLQTVNNKLQQPDVITITKTTKLFPNNHNMTLNADANIPLPALQPMNPYVYSSNNNSNSNNVSNPAVVFDDIIIKTSKPILAPANRYRGSAWPLGAFSTNDVHGFTDQDSAILSQCPNATMIMENISSSEYPFSDACMNGNDNNKPPPSMFPTEADLFENVPALMPDHLLKEIFEMSGSPPEELATNTNVVTIPNGICSASPATTGTTIEDGGTSGGNGEAVCNDLIDFSGFAAHSAGLSSPSWSSTELSPVNLMANEFDNLSLNSTSSSSLGSVSSYVT